MELLVESTFSGVYGYNENVNIQLSAHVTNIIMNLPWFFKVPLIVYIYFIGFIAYFMKLKPLKKYSKKQSLNFYKNIVLKLPFSSALDKLIRSLGFMKLYDLTMSDI